MMDGCGAERARHLLLDAALEARDGGHSHTTGAPLPFWFVFPTTLCPRVGNWLPSYVGFPVSPVHDPWSLFKGKSVTKGRAALCTRSGGEWELRKTRRDRR